MKTGKQAAKSLETYLDSQSLFSHIISHGKECRLPLADAVTYLQKYNGDKVYDSTKTLELLKSCRDKFTVKTVEGEKFVEAISSLKFCDRFMFPFKEGYCDQRSCDKLHICRGFLEESCRFGERCNKPHSFSEDTTKRLLIQHNLNSLSSGNLKTLFQKALRGHKIRYEASTSGPRACVFYRQGRTCNDGDKCKFFHVCENYINGSCKSEVECGLSHSFETRHAKRVLATHNLGDVRNGEQILSILRSNVNPRPETCDEKPQTSLDMKLFSHLIVHGEECRLPTADVVKCLQEFCRDEEYDAKKTVEFVHSKCEKLVVRTIKGEQLIEVKTSLQLCDSFMFPHTNEKCSPKSCAKLHICRLFLEEKCGFGERCNKPHGFDNHKTQKLLEHHKLDTLSSDVLKILFQKVLKDHKIEYAKVNLGLNASDQRASRTNVATSIPPKNNSP